MTRFAPNFAADSRGNPKKRNRATALVYLIKFRKLLKYINCGNFLKIYIRYILYVHKHRLYGIMDGSAKNYGRWPNRY